MLSCQVLTEKLLQIKQNIFLSGKQNYLVFLPINKYFKLNSVVNTADYVSSWQSKALSNESIKPVGG